MDAGNRCDIKAFEANRSFLASHLSHDTDYKPPYASQPFAHGSHSRTCCTRTVAVELSQ